MKTQYLNQLITAILMSFVASSVMAQGVMIYKKDGSKIKIPYENFDRMESYNYDEIITEEYSVGGVSIKMVEVVGGTFLMGAQNVDSSLDNYNDKARYDESPVHEVTVSDFYIGETEVTQGFWKAVMNYTGTCADGSTMSAYAGSDEWPNASPSTRYGLGNEYPAYYVSYNDIVKIFIPRLNKITGKKFRLPTEAEWEYAARGGNQSQGYKYSGSNAISDVVWCSDNSSSSTHPVGTKQPNELGIYDMSGNVYEWCSDWYGSYTEAAQTDPTGPSSGSYRVLRSGSIKNIAQYCRVSSRGMLNPDYSPNGDYSGDVGFRLALSH